MCGFVDFHIDSNGRFVFSDKMFKCSSAYHALMVALLFYVLTATKDQIVGSTSTTLIMFNASGVTLLFIVNKFSQKYYEKRIIAPLWKHLGIIEQKMRSLKMILKYKIIATQSTISFFPTQVLLTALVIGQYYVSLTMSSSKTTALIFAVILYFMETERTAITGQFCSLLIVINNMFQTIAEKINNHKAEHNIQTELRFLAIFHHDLCKAVRKINRIYTTHLILSFAVDLLCFITYTQLITYDLLKGKVTSIGALSMTWMLVLSSRILAIITVSHSCVSAVGIYVNDF